MILRRLSLVALFVGTGLACTGTTTPTEAPPPPPPPPPGATPTDPAAPVAVVIPPVETSPVAVDPHVLPPPWGDLGFSYGNAVVLHVDPGLVVLTLPSGATADAEALYTAWEQRLVANGYAAGVAYTSGVDAGEPWMKGDQHVSIARGIVGTSAYVYAEDLQKVTVSAVEKRTVDDSVAKLIGMPTAPATKAPVAKTTEPKTTTPPAVAHTPTASGSGDTTQGKGMSRDATGTKDGKHKGGKSGGKPKKDN